MKYCIIVAMNKEILVFIRNFLFKMFIVGVIFAIFLFVMTWSLWDFWSSFIYSKFLVTEKELGALIVNFFIWLRFYLIFLILVPVIALHWTIKS